MSKILDILKTLTPEEKQELSKRLKVEAMDEKSRFKNGAYCPLCSSIHVFKNGKLKGKQRYFCKDCHKNFTIYKGTILHGSRHDVFVWKQYIDLMFVEGYSLTKTAAKLGLSLQTAALWRYKILNTLVDKFMGDNLSGIIEADETFVRESSKGVEVTHRAARKSGIGKFSKEEPVKRGLSKEQFGALIALDRRGNVVSEVYGRGKVNSKQISAVLHDRVSKDSILITDACRAYVKFAKEEGIQLKQLKGGEAMNKLYHINTCNSYHSHLKNFLRRFNGISTKRLTEYLAWFKFIKQKNDVGYLFNELILGDSRNTPLQEHPSL